MAMMTIGSLYYLIPRLYGRTEMYSVRLINTHFWMSTIGVIFYVVEYVDRGCDAGPDVAGSE